MDDRTESKNLSLESTTGLEDYGETERYLNQKTDFLTNLVEAKDPLNSEDLSTNYRIHNGSYNQDLYTLLDNSDIVLSERDGDLQAHSGENSSYLYREILSELNESVDRRDIAQLMAVDEQEFDAKKVGAPEQSGLYETHIYVAGEKTFSLYSLDASADKDLLRENGWKKASQTGLTTEDVSQSFGNSVVESPLETAYYRDTGVFTSDSLEALELYFPEADKFRRPYKGDKNTESVNRIRNRAIEVFKERENSGKSSDWFTENSRKEFAESVNYSKDDIYHFAKEIKAENLAKEAGADYTNVSRGLGDLISGLINNHPEEYFVLPDVSDLENIGKDLSDTVFVNGNVGRDCLKTRKGGTLIANGRIRTGSNVGVDNGRYIYGSLEGFSSGREFQPILNWKTLEEQESASEEQGSVSLHLNININS